jgi:hypothetical protein
MGHRALPSIFLALGVVFAPACGSVSVTPPPTGAKAEARPRDCSVEFLRAAPARTYDELGEIYSYYSTVVEPQEVLREKACELGADAVVVTRDFLVSTNARSPDRKLVAGTALKYRDVTGVPEPGR